MSSPKEYHFDAVYPEPLSRLRRGHGHTAMGGLASSSEAGSSAASYRRAVKKQRMNRGCAGRFRTQPVTFQEIKEVDEENVPEIETELSASLGKSVAAGTASRSESDLKARFELFYKSISDADPSTSGTVRSPPIAISFPVCPVHSGSGQSPSPLCQTTCFPSTKTGGLVDADSASNHPTSDNSTGKPGTTNLPATTSTASPLLSNIAAMGLGTRSRQSF